MKTLTTSQLRTKRFYGASIPPYLGTPSLSVHKMHRKGWSQECLKVKTKFVLDLNRIRLPGSYLASRCSIKSKPKNILYLIYELFQKECSKITDSDQIQLTYRCGIPKKVHLFQWRYILSLRIYCTDLSLTDGILAHFLLVMMLK